MAGPPMSICSMVSGSLAPRATVWRNGYRFTATSEMG